MFMFIEMENVNERHIFIWCEGISIGIVRMNYFTKLAARMPTISESKIVKNNDNELQLICEQKLTLVIFFIIKEKKTKNYFAMISAINMNFNGCSPYQRFKYIEFYHKPNMDTLT